MAEHALAPGWPRMPVDEAIVSLARLWELSPQDAAEYVSTDVEGRRFYATAPRRVDKTRLEQLRKSVIELATRHGFPGERSLRASPTFDQELAILFAESMPMLPVEAADEEVWAYITLSVLPDVAIWRWPATPGSPDRTLVDEDGERKAESRVDRLLGRRRGVFRQAWWRGHLLGPDACLRLDEDNFINLTDRVSLTGYKVHGRLITRAHLERLDRPSYDRRFTLRRALVLIGREFGRIAVEALSEDRAKEIIDRAFKQAERDVILQKEAHKAAKTARSTGGEAAAESASEPTDIVDVGTEPEAEPSPTAVDDSSSLHRTHASARDRFLEAAAEFRPVLEPMLVPVDHARAMAMLLRAERHVRALGDDAIAARIYDDLNELIGDWASLSDDERSVVYAALTYFVETEDFAADGGPNGLLDDDAVVDCAFAALGRERNPS